MNIVAKKLFQSAPKNLQINTLTPITLQNFTKFFEDRDLKEIKQYNEELNMHPYYRNLRRQWMLPLEKKQKRKERVKELRAQTPERPEDIEKFVVHNPILGIEYPPKDNEIFAVFEILGKQFKVVENDMVIADYLPDYDINDHLVFDQVYLVGTKHYTSVGRPIVASAKVYATVEEQTYSEKTLVFKYKRRKRAKKATGSKVPLTVLRIDKIEHVLDEQLERAVPLI